MDQAVYSFSAIYLSLPYIFPSRLAAGITSANLSSSSLVASSLTLFPENLTSFLPAKPICSVALDPVSFLASCTQERASTREIFSPRVLTCSVSSFALSLYPRDVPDLRYLYIPLPAQLRLAPKRGMRTTSRSDSIGGARVKNSRRAVPLIRPHIFRLSSAF